MPTRAGHDVIIVGAGFAGLHMLHKLQKAGRSAIVLEAGSGVVGWWKRRVATRSPRGSASGRPAAFRPGARPTCRAWPISPGETYHTADRPAGGVELAGKRVGMVGTGSPGIQAVPGIAREAEHRCVFQRTPNYSVPARNGPLTPDYAMSWKSRYPVLREEARHSASGTLYGYGPHAALAVSAAERDVVDRTRWDVGGPNFLRAFNDLSTNLQANDTAADFVRARSVGTSRQNCTEVAARGYEGFILSRAAA